MPFQKRIDPTNEQKKKIKNLFIYGYSKSKISRVMDISLHLVNRWIRILKIRKIDTCDWCGKRGIGKKIDKKWLCKKCDKNRCKSCTIILSKTRRNKNETRHGNFYIEHPDYCKNCWKKLSTGKSVDKRS